MVASVPEYRLLDSSLRPPRKGARVVGPVDPHENVPLTIVVRRKAGAPSLPDHEHWMSVPPGRRKFLSRAELAATYGAANGDLDAVARFCRDQGFTVVDSSVARRCVDVSGTADLVAKAFQVELKRYQTANESYRGHEGYVQLPAALGDIVEGVLGLDNRRLGTHASNGGPFGAVPLTPIQVAQFYGFPLPVSGLWKDATGQTIGILEFGGGYSVADIKTYYASLNIAKQAQVTSIPASVPYGGNVQLPDPADFEVALDVGVAGAIAQGAKIVIYFGIGFTNQGIPDEKGWHAVVSTAITDATNKPSVLSISWSAPESEWPPGTIALLMPLFQQAAAAGITVFAASGDYGASGYNPNDPNWEGGAHVQYPGSDPYVTSCGGTVLLSNPPPTTQQTWNDTPYQGGATGGGISSLQMPPWQSNVTINGQALSGRGVPDVAGNASTYSGYDLVVYGQKTSDLNIANQQIAATYAGTSAVAPLYAGLIALINANLFPSIATSQNSVGFLNPTLYTLPSGYPSIVFQDISDGANNSFNGVVGYTSVPGWDACTGWGSINGVKLLETLFITYVSENPGCVAALQRLAKALTGG
jgi:kumamolisin